MIDEWIAAWREAAPEARGGLCLECRAVLAEGESCHGRPATTWARWSALRGRTPVKPRRAADAEIEDDPDARRRLRGFGWFTAGMTLVSTAALVDGKPAGAFGLVLAAGGAVAALRFRRRRASRTPPMPEPGGVSVEAVWPELDPSHEPLHGRVTRSDVEGVVAIEERVVLDRPRTDAVYARFGRLLGEATIVLDDAREVRLARGRVCLVDEGGHTETVERAPGEGTRLERLELRVGDRVTLVATLAPDGPGGTNRRVDGVATLGLHAAEKA